MLMMWQCGIVKNGKFTEIQCIVDVVRIALSLNWQIAMTIEHALHILHPKEKIKFRLSVNIQF